MTTYADAQATADSPACRESDRAPGVAASHADGLLDWLERDPAPRLIVDNTLSVRWSNSAARAFLSQNAYLTLTDAALHCANAADQKRLADFVAAVVMSGSLYFDCEERPDFLLIRAERLHSAPADPVVAITLNSGRWAAESVRFDDLEIAFRLTPREMEIVLLLAQGMNVATISTQMDCALETVRRHVKNIYVKIGVSTREELLNRLHPFRR